MKNIFIGLILFFICSTAHSAQLTAGKMTVAASGTTIQDSIVTQTGSLLTVAGSMTLTGDVTAAFYHGNGSLLTGVSGVSGLNPKYVPYASTPTTLVDSTIYIKNTFVGINGDDPQAGLQLGVGTPSFPGHVVDGSDLYVTGDVEIDNGLYVDGLIYGSGAGIYNIPSDGDWTIHDNFPADCPAGQYVYGIGDTLSCRADQTGGGGTISGLTTGYLTVANSSTTIADSFIRQSGSNVIISGGATFGGNLTISGSATLSDGLTVTNGATFGNSINVKNVLYPDIQTAQKEPTGFLDRNATISWSDANYTMTITGTHTIYIDGVAYTKTTASKQIADTTGAHYIYYDRTGTLTEATTFPGTEFPLIAFVYWNTTIDKGVMSDERHGIVMDHLTHSYVHNTIGTRYESGIALVASDTTFSTTLGYIWDEDLRHTISADTTCTIFYKDGSADWSMDKGQTIYYKAVTGDLRYNNGNTLTAVPANQYVAVWFFATGGTENKIITLTGQRVDITLADARLNNTYESLSLGTLPYVEMKLLYRVILRNDGTPYEETLDYRAVSTISSGSYVATAHGTLTGLNNDDHMQYWVSDSTRASNYATTGRMTAGSAVITGAATLDGTTASTVTTGALTVNGNATVTGTISVTGASTLSTVTATSLNKVTITAPATSATLTIADGKTLTATNTVNLNTMTDGKYCTYSSSGTAINCASDAGVTMPLAYLTVTGQSTLSGDVTIGPATMTYATANADLGVKGALMVDGNIYGASGAKLAGSGNVGIGTTNPVAKFQIGSATLNRTDGVNDMLVADALEIDGNMYTEGNIQAFGSGNFGIGTTSPASTLEIDGALYVRGSTAPQATNAGISLGTLSGDAFIVGDLEVDGAVYIDGFIYMPAGMRAISGSVTVCVDTAGRLLKSAVACSGS